MTFADGSITAEDVMSDAAGRAMYSVVSHVAGQATATAVVHELSQSTKVLYSREFGCR